MDTKNMWTNILKNPDVYHIIWLHCERHLIVIDSRCRCRWKYISFWGFEGWHSADLGLTDLVISHITRGIKHPLQLWPDSRVWCHHSETKRTVRTGTNSTARRERKKRLTKLPMNSRPVLGTHNQPKQKPRQNQHITYHRQTESYHRQQGSATSNSCQPQKRLPPATHCLLEDSNGAVNHLGYNLLHRWVKYLSGIRHQSVATASALRHQTIKSMTINTNCPEWLWTFINPLHSPKI
jgi:hypothetical protein